MRHYDVGYDQTRLFGPEFQEGVFSIIGNLDDVTIVLEAHLPPQGDYYFVLDEKNVRHAGIVAASRGDELLAAGDIDGQQAWVAIMRACETLLAQTAPPGTLLN